MISKKNSKKYTHFFAFPDRKKKNQLSVRSGVMAKS